MANTEKELKTIKFQMMLSPSEAEQIDNWMFKHRLKSRADAIRRLCQIAFIADASPKMMLALAVLAHHVKGPLADTMRSGDTLDTDVKRLCYQVIEEGTAASVFSGKEEFSEAVESARRLAQDFANAKVGTHLEKKK